MEDKNMISLTETVNPYLKEILNTQENNFFLEMENYMESFVQFLLLSIISVIILLLAVWAISKIIKYWNADANRSHEIQKWLQVTEGLNTKTVESKVNWIVKGATVRFYRNQVIIKVPTKGWWQGYEHIDCQKEVKRRVESPEFKELLGTHYKGYRFGDVIAKRNCYVIKGENY